MAHSPEPWTIVDAELMPGIPGKAVVSARGDAVAFVYHIFADVEEDNAALLHAAPGLLAACETAAEWLRHFLHYAHQPSLGNPNIDKLERDLIALKDAIDKAKPKAPAEVARGCPSTAQIPDGGR